MSRTSTSDWQPAAERKLAVAGSELAYEQLRSLIVIGELEPGQRLRIADLSARFGFGASVLREALPRLVAEGFVESRAQMGFRVIELTAEDLVNLTEVRLLTESEALRQAIRDGDDEWEASIVASLYLLEKIDIPDLGRPAPEWLQAHDRFHASLLGACPNTYLKNLAMKLRDRGEVFRAWQRPGSAGRDVGDEHRKIMEAVLARDADLAVERLDSHINTTMSRFLECSEANGIPSEG